MLTHRRHRYLTRWRRRLAYALATALLVGAAWYGWRTWQTPRPTREPLGQMASLSTSPAIS